MVGSEALVRCECGELVFPDSVERVSKSSDDRVALEWVHACGARGVTSMLVRPYLAFVESWKQGQRRAEVSASELIGRLVQGWRIELDAVRVPADMVFYWADQERREPWSVRRER